LQRLDKKNSTSLRKEINYRLNFQASMDDRASVNKTIENQL